jgi:iron complex outermembrane receptor protein
LITGVQGASTSASNGEELENTFLPDADQTDLGAYLITSLERGGFGLKAAARGDLRNVEWQDKAKTFALGAGSIGLNWGIAQNVDVLAIASLSKRAPSIAELGADGLHHGAYRYEVGNEDLEAETSKNIELNISKKSVNTALDLTVFRNQIDDFIHYRAEDGVFVDGYQKYNYVSTDALLQGWEIGVNHFDEATGLRAMVAVSYVEGLDLVADTALPFIPPLTLNSSLTYEKKQVLGLNDFFTMLSYTHTSSFEVLSLSLGFAVGSAGNIQFSANNLMNEEYIPVMSLLRELDIPQAGRDFSVSFSVNF